ncbi:MAG: WG repeat-containing protein [Clostridia bacterium]|nr:WG repeat-containing protein [Clostridia bacterium]
MRKYLYMYVMLFVLLIIPFSVDASDDIPNIYINNAKIDSGSGFVFRNSTIYGEPNVLAKLFDANLSVDTEGVVYTFSNKVRNVTYDSQTGSVIVGDRNSFLHNVLEDAYPSIKENDVVYVPLRMICYGFHMDIKYDAELRAVYITRVYDGVGLFNSEGSAIAVNANRYSLVNSAGELLHRFEFDAVSNYDNDFLYKVTSNHRHGLMDSRGNLLTGIEYSGIIYESPSTIYIIKDSLKGMCDIHGKILIPPIYDDIVYCANSIAMVKKSDGWYVLDCARGILSEKKYDEVYKITDGVQSDNDMIEGYYVVRKGKWGCVDSFGNVVIDIKYEALDKFDINGRARVVYNGKIGIVDCGGRTVIPPAYDYLYSFGKLKTTVAMVGDKYGVLDDKADIVVPFEYDYIYPFNDSGSTVAYKNDSFGIISNQGRIISDFDYKYLEEFKNGYALAYKDGYGYIDHMGHEVIPCIHEDVKQGTAMSVFLKDNQRWALFSPGGEMLTDYIFVNAGKFSNGLSAVSIMKDDSEYFGYVNDSGDTVIEFKYTSALDFKYGKAIVSTGKYSGIIDVEGNTIIPFVYTGFNPSYDYNVIAAANEYSKWGLISFTNKMLCEFDYDYIFEFDNGYAPVLKNHKYGIVDVNGKLITELKYDTKEDALKALSIYESLIL